MNIMRVSVRVPPTASHNQAESFLFSRLRTAQRLRSLMAGFVALAAATFLSPSARSQTGPTEDELERQSLKLAIEVVSVTYPVLRWPPSRFPLHVTLVLGEDLKGIACSNQWQRRFEDYVRFMNIKQVSLTLAEPADGQFDAYVFYGSKEEFGASVPSRLEDALSAMPGVVAQYRMLSRSDYSGLSAYGSESSVRFAVNFIELSARGIDQVGHCRSVDPAYNLGMALLQGYVRNIGGLVSSLADEQTEPTLEWRTQRRLFSAMKRLPSSGLSAAQLKSALIEALSNE